MIDEKTIKAMADTIIENAYSMAEVVAKGDRAQVGPGPKGMLKFSRVRHEFIKTGRGKDRPKS